MEAQGIGFGVRADWLEGDPGRRTESPVWNLFWIT